MGAIRQVGLAATWFDLPVVLPGLYMAGALLVGAAIIALVRRWWMAEEPGRTAAGDQLAHFRSLYEKGQLSEEEYKRLRKVLGGEMRKALDLPAAAGKPDVSEAPRAGPPGPESPPEGIRPA